VWGIRINAVGSAECDQELRFRSIDKKTECDFLQSMPKLMPTIRKESAQVRLLK
jgi:hypothetical protein